MSLTFANKIPLVIVCPAQKEAIELVVNILGCRASVAKSLLISFRWDKEKLMSECRVALLRCSLSLLDARRSYKTLVAWWEI